MKPEQKLDNYCADLVGAACGARRSGVDNLSVLNGLVGTIAMSIRAGGGNDGDVADAFRAFARCYESRAAGQ